MKNLKSLNRKELKTVLGGAALACEVPVDGGCPAGYTFCSNPLLLSTQKTIYLF